MVASMLAGAIEQHGLTDPTSWDISQGMVATDTDRVLAKAGPAINHTTWATTYDQGDARPVLPPPSEFLAK